MTQALDLVETKRGADISGLSGAIGSEIQKYCETERWSDEAIRCVLDADDTVTAGFCLRSVNSVLAHDPFGLTLQTVPSANLSDRRCSVVAKHWYDLMTPSRVALTGRSQHNAAAASLNESVAEEFLELADLAAELASADILAAVQGFAATKAAWLAQTETACESWPAEAQRCVLQVATAEDLRLCFDAMRPTF